MGSGETRAPVQAGEPAPEFVLPALNHEGTVSLADYRGKSPLLLAIFRGLFCAFCRRAIAQVGSTREKLEALGVQALGIVGTSRERARLYFRFHPPRLPLAADPELSTHRAYGLPSPAVTPELIQAVAAARINPTGELPAPLPPLEASEALDRLDGFAPTQTDHEDHQRQWTQLIGQFLIDRDGVVRWANIECARDGLGGIGMFPTEEEFLAAARAL